jgi:TPR repeat protein
MRRKTRQIAFQTLRDLPKDELAVRFSSSPEDAAASIASAARYGLVEAQLLFGQILLDGSGTPRDPAAAVLWFGAARRR